MRDHGQTSCSKSILLLNLACDLSYLLQRIAPKYFDTLFIRVFVENVPWLVERLCVQVLPCVITFVNGVSKDRFVGFEELGNTDEFDTATLEWKLLNSGTSMNTKSLSSVPTLFLQA